MLEETLPCGSYRADGLMLGLRTNLRVGCWRDTAVSGLLQHRSCPAAESGSYGASFGRCCIGRIKCVYPFSLTRRGSKRIG